MMQASNQLKIERAAKISLAATVLLVIIKLWGGWTSGSVSVMSEALQSFIDIAVGIGVLQTIRYASKPPDADHPYGHGKAELLAGALQMILVVAVSGFMFGKALERYRQPTEIDLGPAVWTMVIALAIDIAIIIFMLRSAKKYGSTLLKTEAVHLLGDGAAALGILIGLGLIKVTGNVRIDSIVAMIFAGAVVIIAIRQIANVVHDLMDGALSSSDIKLIESLLDTHPQVRGYHDLRTRRSGSTRHVDMHILFDDDLSFIAAHDLAEEIEQEIKNAVGPAMVTVHYEPYEHELRHRDEMH